MAKEQKKTEEEKEEPREEQYMKEQIVSLFERGILLHKELMGKEIGASLVERIEAEQDLLVINDDYLSVLCTEPIFIDWYEIDGYRVEAEKEKDEGLYHQQLQKLQPTHFNLKVPWIQHEQKIITHEKPFEITPIKNDIINNKPLESFTLLIPQVQVLVSYKNTPHPYAPKDFTSLFLSRYHFIEGLLRQRRELQNLTTIARVLTRKERETTAIIGLIQEKIITKKGNLLIKIEDPTGIISVLINQEKKELFSAAQDLVFDEVVGISGTSQGSLLFGEQIVWPDIPQDRELKKSENEEYAVFLSDLHVGSRLFLQDAFQKFLLWIQGNLGNEQQRAIAQKVKYVLISGDVVDGVGIYPSQEEELAIRDIREQYREVARLLRQIPEDKHIVMCPGNHDTVHLAEPQPVFYKEYAEDLFTLPHATLISNPGLITIGKTATFSGFDVLLYHGYSFDYYIANVGSLRAGGGYKRADLTLKFLLKRRHLAPSFKSTPYYPGHQEDPLLIKTIPDFFVTGHIHYCSVAHYKGVTLISGSCWQDKTSFQEKLGHDPEPARVPLVNLKTREVKVLRFQ